MSTYSLIPHPGTPSAAVTTITVEATYGERLTLVFRVEGDAAAVRWPEPVARSRTDELWRHSCFEAFVMDGAGYREFNLSPSGAWAAYAFDDYRTGMRDADADIICAFDDGTLTATIAADLPPSGRLGLSAVIELVDGSKSYWALAHPPGKPDFHHPACFMAELPAPPAA